MTNVGMMFVLFDESREHTYNKSLAVHLSPKKILCVHIMMSHLLQLSYLNN
jgi:hypothetical protein